MDIKPSQCASNQTMLKQILSFLNFPRKRHGLFVVVMGLDGSGKSTLIELVSHSLEQLFNAEIDHFHFTTGLFPPLASFIGRRRPDMEAVTNPHGKPTSGKFLSMIRLGYYLLDCLLGVWLIVYPKLLKTKPHFVFFDRYFYDCFIDPARYRINLGGPLLWSLKLLVPRPDLIIMLVPHPEVFHQRKPELPLTELRRQADRMHKLADALNHVKWVDTCNSINASVGDITEAIIHASRDTLPWLSIPHQ